MKLVIVESPTKARTIGKFLGPDYIIKASMGHVVDLPKSKIGIDFEHGFAPQFEVISDKKQVISELKIAAKSADSIILATDPDREGEAIAYHVSEILPIHTNTTNKPISRIVFHEITKEAIEEALKSPRKIDKNLVDAQTARRVLDRLVGYKLSPLLWKKVRRGLSAGRVQSVALRLIVEREKEIEKFQKEKYYAITAMLIKGAEGTEFELIEINNEKIEVSKSFDLYDGQYKITKTSIDSSQKAQEIAQDLKTKTFIVSDVLQKESKRSPAPPYTTSTLQQDASRRLYINGRRTMSLAQKLYEEGYITYHRTDSVAIGSNAIFAIRNFVTKEYGEKYIPEKPRFYSAKQKLAQEAHEAIRPTSVGQVLSIKDKVLSIAGNQGWKLYELIWRRAVASQMSDSIIESTTVFVDAQPYKLKANGSVLVFDGFLKVNPLGLSDNKLPKFNIGEKLNLIDVLEKEHETLPPPRYNDASIIKTLEEKGIGRPSTYATIISTIEARQYVEKIEGKFQPTPVGQAVNDFLVQNFSEVDDIPFTSQMEDKLDDVAHGKTKWVPMIGEFYKPFEKKLKSVEDAKRVKIEVEETGEKCPLCKIGNVIIRTARFGKFLSCSRFPECKFTKPFVEKTGLKCPKDRGEIMIKKTHKGRKFYGCFNYPKCAFAAWRLEDIKKA